MLFHVHTKYKDYKISFHLMEDIVIVQVDVKLIAIYNVDKEVKVSIRPTGFLWFWNLHKA